MTAAARLFALPGEPIPASQWCQRWNAGTHTWRHRSQGGFDADRYSVEPLDENPLDESRAKRYITANHYSTSYPAALARWALRDRDSRLVGVAVIGVPMSTAVLTNVFGDLEPITESAELCRLCLNDSVASNGETWFLALVFAHVAARGLRGIVTFADPVPRFVAGRVLFPGHIGTIYQAKGVEYLGRSTPRTPLTRTSGRPARRPDPLRPRRPESPGRRTVILKPPTPPRRNPAGGPRCQGSRGPAPARRHHRGRLARPSPRRPRRRPGPPSRQPPLRLPPRHRSPSPLAATHRRTRPPLPQTRRPHIRGADQP